MKPKINTSRCEEITWMYALCTCSMCQWLVGLAVWSGKQLAFNLNSNVTSSSVQTAEVFIPTSISHQNWWRHLKEGWNFLKWNGAVAFDFIHTVMFFLELLKGLTYFFPPNLWQIWGQQQEVPGVQEADAAADQSAPDRLVCMQLSRPGFLIVRGSQLAGRCYFSDWIKRTSCPAVLFDVNRNNRNVPKLDPQTILCFLSSFIINCHCCLLIYHTHTLSVVSCPPVCLVQTWFSACWLERWGHRVWTEFNL